MRDLTDAELHPSIALYALDEIERATERARALAVAGRLAIERQGKDGDLTAASLFAVIEQLLEGDKARRFLRDFIAAQTRADG
jgi:hypothetical protein